jgi:hypothetical protein
MYFYRETYPDMNGHGMFIYLGDPWDLTIPSLLSVLRSCGCGSEDEFFRLLSQKSRGSNRQERQ